MEKVKLKGEITEGKLKGKCIDIDMNREPILKLNGKPYPDVTKLTVTFSNKHPFIALVKLELYENDFESKEESD